MQTTGTQINRGLARTAAIALAATAGFIGFTASASAGITTYTFGSLGVADNTPFAINASGEVVGGSGGQAVYSTGGSSLTPLSGLGSPDSSLARGLNAGGVVVGSYTPSSGSQTAFYLATGAPSPNLPITFGGLAGGAVTNLANAVNSSNKVVGDATYTGGGQIRAYVWTGGSSTLTPIDPVSGTGAPTNTGLGGGVLGSSTANGINSSGLIVGQATNSTGSSVGFLYSPTQSKMYDLGSLGTAPTGSGNSNALAINNAGEIVGETDHVISGTDYEPRAFIIKSGYTIPTATASADQLLFTGPTGMIDIGTLGTDLYSEAMGVNSSGLVVGWSGDDSGGSASHAFIYDSAAVTPTMIDLNNSSYVTGLPIGWTIDSATGINDAGQITGYADNGLGATYAFVLSPSPVPEPTMGMVLTSAAAFKLLGRRRRAGQNVPRKM